MMPKDLAKIKRNVAKMVAQSAPETDIDAYIASEGATVEEIQTFKENQQSVRERIPQTKVGKFFGEMANKIPSLPFPLNLTPVGMTFETMKAMGGGAQTIANAFQPNVTPRGTPQRTLEAMGRGGEVLTGAAQIAGAPFAGIPYIGEAIDAPLDWAVENQPQYKQFKQLTNAFGIPEVGQTAKDVAKIGMYSAVGLAIPGAKPTVQKSALKARTRTATKIGALAEAGENLPLARRAGQYIAEEKIPITKKTYAQGERGLEMKSTGALEAESMTGKLANEMNSKIIDPATQAGVVIDGTELVKKATEIHDTALTELIPDQATLMRYEREIKQLQKTVEANNGKITPRQAQDFKTRNNALLQEIYQRAQGGKLTEKQAARQKVLLETNRGLREQLESIDPQIRGINWTEGAGLDVTKALNKYLEYRMGKDPSLARGTAISGAARGVKPLMALFAWSELVLYKPFRITFNKLLNRTATRISGAKSEFVRPGTIKPPDFLTGGNMGGGTLPPFLPPTIPPIPLDVIPPSFKRAICEELNIPLETPDAQVIAIAKWRNKYENAPTEEAPVSQGGSMSVRGKANKEQIKKFNK